MSRGGRALRDIYATLLLGAAVYFGLTGADDILNTTTVWERSIGVTATLYGIAALLSLYAYWRRTTWLIPIALLWAILITTTATLAVTVYSATLPGILGAFIVTALIAGSVHFACRSRSRESAD